MYIFVLEAGEAILNLNAVFIIFWIYVYFVEIYTSKFVVIIYYVNSYCAYAEIEHWSRFISTVPTNVLCVVLAPSREAKIDINISLVG